MFRGDKILILVVVAMLWPFYGLAQSAFEVGEIEIRGLERTSEGTVLNYLPIREGERFEPQDSGRAIRTLYETGLFSDVKLSRRGNTLIVELSERPAIGSIDISGNEELKTEQLEQSLKDVGIAPGQVFDRSLLDRVEQELRRLYFSLGRYAIRMQTDVTELERNRVAINIDISEGEVARIRHINIIGNENFADDELLDLLESGIPGTFAFFSSADEYSRSKLQGDLETLRSFYLDRGFVRFQVASTQVSISPDKRNIYITINISEGERYRVKDVELAGNTVLPAAELRPLIVIDEGQEFSRKLATTSTQALTERLGEEGYAFSNVNVVPQIDDENREVSLTFFFDPGKRVYVRRIEFIADRDTLDEVFRREMRQFEGGWYSPRKLNRSKVRLERLPFVESATVETPRVPGTTDQVDIVFTIRERSSGTFSIGAGVSSSDGLIFNLNLTQQNAFGTGERLSFSIDNSSSTEQLSVSYTDPYYTNDGISRTYSVFVRETDASEFDDTSDFLIDASGGSIAFGVPTSEFSSWRLSLGVEQTSLSTTSQSPIEVDAFVDEFGDSFDRWTLGARYTHDTRDRTIFATSGTRHRVNAEISMPASDLEFYKLGYEFRTLWKLTEDTSLMLRGEVNYGEGYGDFKQLPFFEKYFAGGIRSIRGFESRSLGPRDSNDNAFGGDLRTVGGVELLLPMPLSEESRSTRLALFIDIGNVFEDADSFESDELRASAGVALNWLSPIGPLIFSFADAIESQAGDETETFQFSIGSTF